MHGNSMTLPSKTKTWLETTLQAKVRDLTPVAGGCINETYIVTLSHGKRLFLKYHSSAAMFDAEALGLTAINQQVPRFAPEPIAHSDECLIMTCLTPAAPNRRYWQALGEKLAQLHAAEQHYFGFKRDNFCGETPQPNAPTDDGFAFFAEHRLMFQAKRAFDTGKLDRAVLQQVEKLASQLERWIPEQPPSLIHGDLWSGNAMNTSEGAKIFDPAAHYGWAEADLAMTTLFGEFDPVFYEAYQTTRNINAGWRTRADLYNAYHVLNHLNLFGGHYGNSLRRILRQYLG